MSKQRSETEEQAIGWIIRLRDPMFADWDSFTLWLEADPSHAEVYEMLALVDEQAAGSLFRSDPS